MFERVLKILIVLVVVSKLALLGTGARAVPDEYFYNYSFFCLEKIYPGYYDQSTTHIFATGRPLSALIHLIPAGGQSLLYYFTKIDPRDKLSLIIPLGFNMFISILVLVAFYRLLRKLFTDRLLALTGVLIYSVCVNNTVYVRHLFPYDIATLFYMVGLICALRPKSTWHNSLFTGLLSAMCFASYPGYYLISVGVFMLVVYRAWQGSPSRIMAAFKAAVWFGIGFAGLLVAFEALSHYGSIHYFRKLADLSGTISHGDFLEGYKFPLQYFIEVEQFTGIVIMLAFVAAFWISAGKALMKQKDQDIVILIMLVSIAITYSYHVLQSTVLQKMVFYGRLLHVYYPVMIIALLYIINEKVSGIRSRWVTGLIVGGSTITYTLFYASFASLAYPLDVISNLHIDTNHAKYWNDMEKAKAYRNHKETDILQGTVLCNFSYFAPKSPAGPAYVPPADATLIYEGAHFQNCKAYQFEGLTEEQRAIFRNVKLKVFTLKDFDPSASSAEDMFDIDLSEKKQKHKK